MKTLFLIIAIAIYGAAVPDLARGQESAVAMQRKDRGRDEKKKDPPGPPVVNDKNPKNREKGREKPPPKKPPKPHEL